MPEDLFEKKGPKNPLIAVLGAHFAYPGKKPVLSGLDFSLGQTDKIGLIAPNGSGKTTLFYLIMGLITPSAGTIRIFGRTMRREKDFVFARRRIGFLFQDADDQLFCPSVLEDVAFGPLNLGKSKDEAVAAAKKTLALLGLSGFENKMSFQLSGGEKRLVSLATVLSMDPKVLLLDEPTTGLDTRTRNILIEHLNRLDLPCVVISHDMDFLSKITRCVYTMDQGKIRKDASMSLHTHIHAHAHGDHRHEH